MTYNPFEEKRRIKRLNDLLQERDELKERLAEAVKELDGFKMQTGLWDDIARNNRILIKELDYMRRRCEAAEKYISESPCDPDIHAKQIKAHQEWTRIIEEGNEHAN